MEVTGMTLSQVTRLWELPILLFMEGRVMTLSQQVMGITASMVILVALETMVIMIGGGTITAVSYTHLTLPTTVIV